MSTHKLVRLIPLSIGAAALLVTCFSLIPAPAAAEGPTPVLTHRFVGVNEEGVYQAALEDALLQADAFFATQGADLRYDYRVRSASGTRGGFFFQNSIRVEIVATGQ